MSLLLCLRHGALEFVVYPRALGTKPPEVVSIEVTFASPKSRVRVRLSQERNSVFIVHEIFHSSSIFLHEGFHIELVDVIEK
jgi:hypothetical protein